MSQVDAFGRCTRCGVRNESTGSCINCATGDALYNAGATPHKCPCCDGTGKVSRPPWVPGDVDTWASSTVGELFECQACKGKGIVWKGPLARFDFG
jgi:hypothetical protein